MRAHRFPFRQVAAYALILLALPAPAQVADRFVYLPVNWMSDRTSELPVEWITVDDGLPQGMVRVVSADAYATGAVYLHVLIEG